jgi:hypothetical protein
MNFTFWDGEISSILLCAPVVIFTILTLVVIIMFLTISHNYRGWDWSDGWDEVKPGAIISVLLLVYIITYGYFYASAYDWLDKSKLEIVYTKSKLCQVLDELKAKGYKKYVISNSKVILKSENNNGVAYEFNCTNTDNRHSSSWITIADANNTNVILIKNGFSLDGSRSYCVYDTDKAAEMRYINKLIYTQVMQFPTIAEESMCYITLDTTSVSTNCSENSIDVTVNKSEEDKRNINLRINE